MANTEPMISGAFQELWTEKTGGFQPEGESHTLVTRYDNGWIVVVELTKEGLVDCQATLDFYNAEEDAEDTRVDNATVADLETALEWALFYKPKNTCADCKGNGTILLFVSSVKCTTCDGTGFFAQVNKGEDNDGED